MRYHYEKPSIYLSMYGSTYICDHPVYSKCTLFIIKDKGLAVIQQRYDEKTKSTTWGEVDPWLTDILYLNTNFKKFFDYQEIETEKDLETQEELLKIVNKLLDMKVLTFDK